MTSQKLKFLQNLWLKGQNLSQRWLDADLPLELSRFMSEYLSLQDEADPLLRKTAGPAAQSMLEVFANSSRETSLRHFTALLVPIERILGKNITDHEVLTITHHDRLTKPSSRHPLILILDNLRSAFNVGAILRTAECLSVEKLILTGYTPLPNSEKVMKTAMGTESALKWEYSQSLANSITQLKDAGYVLAALETSPQAKNLHQVNLAEKLALLVGNERFGLTPEQLLACDLVIQIPVFGIKNSLNVATSLAVAAYEWKRQH